MRLEPRQLPRPARAALLLLAALLSCAEPRDELVVLAAASLGEAFRQAGQEFERERPGIRVLFSFSGSQTLATQLRAGVRADVIAVASPSIMAELERDARVSDPREFASNRLVWLFAPSAAPADPEALARELPHSNWRLVLAAPEVPAGRYALEALERLGLVAAVEARVMSRELDVKGVLAKVQLGGADAGIVYATDATAEIRENWSVVDFPERAQVRPRYLVAAVQDGDRELVRAFIAFLGGVGGQRILREHGFGGAA